MKKSQRMPGLRRGFLSEQVAMCSGVQEFLDKLIVNHFVYEGPAGFHAAFTASFAFLSFQLVVMEVWGKWSPGRKNPDDICRF